MSDLNVEGFKASEIISNIASAFTSFSEAEKKSQIKKTNGIFELRIKNEAGKEAVWSIDLKEGTVYAGAAKPKPDVTLIMSDDDFAEIAAGKLNGQKAFMTGRLKTKGNMVLATKLDSVLKTAKAKAKL